MFLVVGELRLGGAGEVAPNVVDLVMVLDVIVR